MVVHVEPPSMGPLESTVTRVHSANRKAAAKPAAPAPMMSTGGRNRSFIAVV